MIAVALIAVFVWPGVLRQRDAYKRAAVDIRLNWQEKGGAAVDAVYATGKVGEDDVSLLYSSSDGPSSEPLSGRVGDRSLGWRWGERYGGSLTSGENSFSLAFDDSSSGRVRVDQLFGGSVDADWNVSDGGHRISIKGTFICKPLDLNCDRRDGGYIAIRGVALGSPVRLDVNVSNETTVVKGELAKKPVDLKLPRETFGTAGYGLRNVSGTLMGKSAILNIVEAPHNIDEYKNISNVHYTLKCYPNIDADFRIHYDKNRGNAQVTGIFSGDKGALDALLSFPLMMDSLGW